MGSRMVSVQCNEDGMEPGEIGQWPLVPPPLRGADCVSGLLIALDVYASRLAKTLALGDATSS